MDWGLVAETAMRSEVLGVPGVGPKKRTFLRDGLPRPQKSKRPQINWGLAGVRGGT